MTIRQTLTLGFALGLLVGLLICVIWGAPQAW